MSLRYTASASMEETAFRDGERLRDVERWKDKIEVRLDNRQVFFLFFGSAVVACMLFVLGVIVGKRIESRGRADALEVQDPLAALDRARQLSSTGTGTGSGSGAGSAAPVPAELTFPKALGGAMPRGAAARSERSTLAAAPTLPVRLAPALPVPVRPAQMSTLTPTAAPAFPRPLVAKVAVATPIAPKPVIAADPAKVRGKYTLQLSAFPSREEADAFARKFAGQGTFVIPTEVPGKGTWYRVRAGNFGTYQEATAAKASFEKQNKVIALIAAR